MMTSRRLLRQALLSRHYPHRPPAPTPELLQRADELLRERPTTTSAWHSHLDAVHALIKDLQPTEVPKESWRAWNAKVKLWTHWLEGVAQLHELGAFPRPANTARRRLKADDFTPLLLAIKSPSWFKRRAAKDGTQVPEAESVYRLIYELGLQPTPFQLLLAVQMVPIGEIFDRAERLSNANEADGEPVEGFDRVAVQLYPLLRPTRLNSTELRHWAERHDEIELEKLLQYIRGQVIRAVAQGDMRFEPALRAFRWTRKRRLSRLLDKIVKAESGKSVQITLPELEAAKEHVMDMLYIGTCTPYVKYRGRKVRLTDPIEAYGLLAAGTSVFLRSGQLLPESTVGGLEAASTSTEPLSVRSGAPSPPATSLLSSLLTSSPFASPTERHPATDATDTPPTSIPSSAFHTSSLSLVGTSPTLDISEHLPRVHPAQDCLKHLARSCTRNGDFKGTLRLCAATSYPLFGQHEYMAPYLAGAAHTPEDLKQILPHLERLRVIPRSTASRQERTPEIVWRLRRLALLLDASAERSEKPCAQGSHEESKEAASSESTGPTVSYSERINALCRNWGLLSAHDAAEALPKTDVARTVTTVNEDAVSSPESSAVADALRELAPPSSALRTSLPIPTNPSPRPSLAPQAS